MVSVGADLIKDGHDLLGARTLFKGPGDDDWSVAPMYFGFDTDRWFGEFPVDRLGRWTFTVEGLVEHPVTWTWDEPSRKSWPPRRGERSV